MTQAPVQESISSRSLEAQPGGRWLMAILAGLLAGVPVSVALSFAALLPLYLGPFFFLLFGLAVGAAVFRVAKPLRPILLWRIIPGCAVVIIPVFAASLTFEYWQLGPHAGKMVAKKTRQLPPGTSPKEFRAGVGHKMREHIAAEYPPGGVLGYVRWASSSGRVTVETPGAQPPKAVYTLSQSPIGWTLRVMVSLTLLTGGVLSQVLPLRRAEPPPKETESKSPDSAQPAEAG